MAAIVKVVNGEVAICGSYGGVIRKFKPQSGGKAVFVDVNPSSGLLLVTTESGTVIVCTENAGWVRAFSGDGKKIVLARWQGDEIFTQNADGSCVLRNAHGGWIRPL